MWLIVHKPELICSTSAATHLELTLSLNYLWLTMLNFNLCCLHFQAVIYWLNCGEGAERFLFCVVCLKTFFYKTGLRSCDPLLYRFHSCINRQGLTPNETWLPLQRAEAAPHFPQLPPTSYSIHCWRCGRAPWGLKRGLCPSRGWHNHLSNGKGHESLAPGQVICV